MTLPGCDHGHCGANPLECVCDEGWLGPLCNCPICKAGLFFKTMISYLNLSKINFITGCNMEHGYCTGETLNECLCYPGWKGEHCDECITYPGCPASGTCQQPWECICPEV